MMLNGKDAVCCFTGHRKIESYHTATIKPELDRILNMMIGSGIKTFRAGGAMGFDTLAALTVLELREKDPEVRLELCLPCKEQTAKWDDESIAIYNDILERADKVTYVSERYTKDCMLARNRFMVDGSVCCIAYCTNENALRGGTAYTVRYAVKSGVKVINLCRFI